jgi:hypothetical protein
MERAIARCEQGAGRGWRGWRGVWWRDRGWIGGRDGWGMDGGGGGEKSIKDHVEASLGSPPFG